MIRWIGITFMLATCGLMAGMLPYAGNFYEFISLPSMPRLIFFFLAGLVMYLVGRHRRNKSRS